MDALNRQSVIGSEGAGDEMQQLRERLDQAESRLLQLEKMAAVGQIAAGVAHEINNPVGFISSNLGSLKTYMERVFAVIGAYERMEAALPPEHPMRVEVADVRAEVEFDYLRQDIPDLLTESLDGLARVKEIINDLKDFSRVDDGHRQEADLHRGLESTLNVIRNEIKYKAEVIREFGELPLVNCVPAQINQVFMNLLSNAAQAIETMGRITLRTGADADCAWVEVSDTGKGIPPEVQARIFEPFFTTKPVGKGTGLGLSISRDIVQRHGGMLEVSSTVGEGTTFRLVLPIAGLPDKGG
jgi:two-component system, NtrC family, sensor kinase